MKQKYFINILIIILLLFSTTSFAIDTTNNNENIIETTQETEEISDEENTNLNLYSKSCILVEHSTNRIAYEKNAEEKMYPASTTKILTAILTIEHCDLNEIVTITQEMTSKVPVGYTTAYLTSGEQLTIEQLLNLLLIPSANDAGYALAIHISGSVEEFANLMNEKALQIGCTNSHFTNPCGIHDENHYSTARDMSLIGLYSLNYPQIVNIGCTTSYNLQPSNSYPRTFETTNTLIKADSPNYYEFATGLKTGYTIPAGCCLISTAKKDNMEFLAVVLDAPQPQKDIIYRDLDSISLFDYGFSNYEEITKIGEDTTTIPIEPTVSIIPLDTILLIGLSFLILYFIFTVFKLRKNKS